MFISKFLFLMLCKFYIQKSFTRMFVNSDWCIISKYKNQLDFLCRMAESSIEIFEKCSFLCKVAGKFHLFCFKNSSFLCKMAEKFHVFCFEKGSFLCKVAGKFHEFCFQKGSFLCKVAGKFHEGSF